MTNFAAPRTETEWSRRAIINVVDVLSAHSESLTLIGAHAILLRTAQLDVPSMPTSDGDLGITPGLVGSVPSVERLLADAGYEHRTMARPGLWGRGRYEARDGSQSFREKIDLLAPHAFSGAVSRKRRGVPVLQPAHGKLTVGNALGLELASLNRSRMTIIDFADTRLSSELFVAESPALILAKGSKVGERLEQPSKGPVRDKDVGDLWRLIATADVEETADIIAGFLMHHTVGNHIRRSLDWTSEVLGDPVNVERAKSVFDTFVDPAEIEDSFRLWARVLREI